MTLARTAAADLVLLLAGLAVVARPARRLGLPAAPQAAIAFVAGVGLLAVITTVAGVVGLPTGRRVTWPALAVAAAVGAVEVGRSWLRHRHRGGARWPHPDAVWAGYAVAVAVTARFAVTAWRSPVRSNDEYMMWALRGRVLATGHLNPQVFGSAANGKTYQSREYPIGLPALYSWISGWVGPRWAEIAAHVQIPLLGGAALIVAVWTLREMAGAIAGVLIAPVFFAVAWVGSYTGVLFFADLPVAGAALVVILLLLWWLGSRDPAWLWLAAGPAAAAALFKQEGLVFVAAGCLMAAATAWALRHRVPGRWWAPLLVLAAAVAARLPWQLWLMSEHIGSRFLRPPLPRYGVADAAHMGRVAAADMVRYWPEPYPVGWLAVPVLLAVALAVLTPALRPAVAYLGGTLLLVLAGIWVQYLVLALSNGNGADVLPGYMAFNAPRVLLLPTVLCWVLPLCAAGAAGRRAPPAVPSSASPTVARDAVARDAVASLRAH